MSINNSRDQCATYLPRTGSRPFWPAWRLACNYSLALRVVFVFVSHLSPLKMPPAGAISGNKKTKLAKGRLDKYPLSSILFTSRANTSSQPLCVTHSYGIMTLYFRLLILFHPLLHVYCFPKPCIIP